MSPEPVCPGCGDDQPFGPTEIIFEERHWLYWSCRRCWAIFVSRQWAEPLTAEEPASP